MTESETAPPLEPERCRADQRDAMRELLGLEETWPAVESSSESAGHA